MPGRCLLIARSELSHRPQRGADPAGGQQLYNQPARPPPQLGAGAGKLHRGLLDVHGRGNFKRGPRRCHHGGELGAGFGGAAGEPEDGGLPVHARPASG